MIERIVWLEFKVVEDGGVHTVATLERNGRLVRAPQRFASLGEAEAAYGSGFREVVERALAAESRRGRWRP